MNNTARVDTHAHTRPAGRAAAVGAHLLSRWPLVLGIVALLFNITNGTDSHVTAMIIILASTCYLAAAAVGSRRSAWVVVAVVSVAVVLARLTGLDPTATVLVLGSAFAVFGLVRGTGEDRREVGRQALAFVGFSAIALTAMMSSPTVAIYLAAATALGHTVWDVIHFVRDKVVTRSLTEACFVLDLGLAIALLLTASAAPQL
ncbi:hypothetical protein O7635_24465 [Asanoa sp. WMMD1127]|uniref:hypothetical protein n=1 Tax=Asanoa sp. WMMD1127 TaxID=3016107 RepID=UPI0024171712|nr:hypothetical protein [Asanoa sp. WMMD1127]MDG4825015.1 hypothetical protein [Asanoa sp. WMMD1127]